MIIPKQFFQTAKIYITQNGGAPVKLFPGSVVAPILPRNTMLRERYTKGTVGVKGFTNMYFVADFGSSATFTISKNEGNIYYIDDRFNVEKIGHGEAYVSTDNKTLLYRENGNVHEVLNADSSTDKILITDSKYISMSPDFSKMYCISNENKLYEILSDNSVKLITDQKVSYMTYFKKLFFTTIVPGSGSYNLYYADDTGIHYVDNHVQWLFGFADANYIIYTKNAVNQSAEYFSFNGSDFYSLT